MPRPSKLKFRNRLASAAGKFYFRCKKEHAPILRTFRRKSDRETFVRDHDAEEHTDLLRRHGVKTPKRQPLGQLLDEYSEHVYQLVRRGKRNPQTLYHYDYAFKYLKRGFGEQADASAISRKAISKYIQWREETGMTKGAKTVKELRALNTALKWAEIPVIDIPMDEIQPESVPTRIFTKDEIYRFIEKLTGPARAFAFTKVRTGLRSVELRAANVGDVDLDAQTIRYELRNKKKRRLVVTALPDDVIPVLRPLVDGRGPDEPLYTYRGRRLLFRTLEGQFLKASKDAGIDPPIAAIGAMRHSYITHSVLRFGVGLTSQAVHHDSEQTTRGYVDQIDEEVIRLQRTIANAQAELIPLPKPNL